MQLVASNQIQNQVIETNEVVKKATSSFIEANTLKVSLEHLKNECNIPVFSKDNETTISHYQFIQKTTEAVRDLFPDFTAHEPDIRVSHVIKGRTPSAIGKPAKELLDSEKMLYYERCAFLIEIPQSKETINGNQLTLSVGGIRAYNQENLYSKKSVEKFKVFVGYNNKVCTNLCISTDGFSNEIRITSIDELASKIEELLSSYNRQQHLDRLQQMQNYRLTEKQFAHFIGKARMFNHLEKSEQKQVFPLALNDGQLNNVVKEYFSCPNFHREEDGSINLWNMYNLFTEANKSSYIDSNLERNVNAYEFINMLGNSIKNNKPNWYYQN